MSKFDEFKEWMNEFKQRYRHFPSRYEIWVELQKQNNNIEGKSTNIIPLIELEKT